MNISKPLAVTIAVAIHGLLSVSNILLSIPFLTGAPLPDDGPPLFIIVLSLILGLLGLVTAWGAWQLKRWGLISTVVLRVVDALAAAPGIFFAPSLGLQLGSAANVILSVVVIWLLLMPATRRIMV